VAFLNHPCQNEYAGWTCQITGASLMKIQRLNFNQVVSLVYSSDVTLKQGFRAFTFMNNIETNTIQNIARIVLGLFMVYASVGHFTFLRQEFQAQVPEWIPISKDAVVIISGIFELSLGLGMVFLTKQKVRIGIALAIFYILIFPGNIAQYINGTDAFGLDTDRERLIRLFFQPVLILWALWSTGALRYLRQKK
jgi:uncharacterized membrane protein